MTAELDVVGFARLFREFLDGMHRLLPPEKPSSLHRRLQEHLGVDPLGQPVVGEAFPAYEHANVQAAIDAYLTEPHRAADLVGIAGSGREHEGLTEIVDAAGRHRTFDLGAVDYATVSVGVGTEVACVRFGLYLIATGDERLAVLVRAGSQRTGSPQLALEVLCVDAEAARRFLKTIRELAVRHHVCRGQVLSFESYEYGDGIGLLRFHERQHVTPPT